MAHPTPTPNSNPTLTPTPTPTPTPHPNPNPNPNPNPEQARHTLTLGALGSEVELELPAGDRPELQLAAGDMVTAGDATLPAEMAEITEGAEMAEVAAPTLTVTNHTAAGDAISRELPISREEARVGLVWVRANPIPNP